MVTVIAAGTGAHTNFSTESMRVDGGMTAILAAIEKLSKTHAEHISQYGTGAGAAPLWPPGVVHAAGRELQQKAVLKSSMESNTALSF